MEQVRPIDATSKPDQVTKSLESLILSHKMTPGEQLPPQKELAEWFNVGVRSVREALKKLEARGLIEVRQGKGVFVRADNLDFYLESLTDSIGFNFPCTKQMLLSLTQVRAIIETAIVRIVAAEADPALVRSLREIVQSMETSGSAPSFDIKEHQRLDMLFHMAIIQASGNLILITLYKHLAQLLFSSMMKSGAFFPNVERGHQEHREIVTAIENRQPELAVKVMSEHLDHTRQILEESYPDTDPE